MGFANDKLTKPLADLGSPNDTPEMDHTHSKGTFIDDLECIFGEFMIPVCK